MLSTVSCLHWRYLSVHCLDTLRLWLLSFQSCFWLYCADVLNCEFLNKQVTNTMLILIKRSWQKYCYILTSPVIVTPSIEKKPGGLEKQLGLRRFSCNLFSNYYSILIFSTEVKKTACLFSPRLTEASALPERTRETQKSNLFARISFHRGANWRTIHTCRGQVNNFLQLFNCLQQLF